MAVAKKSPKKEIYTSSPNSKSIYELMHGTKLTIQIVKNNVIGEKPVGNGKTKRAYMRYSPHAVSIWKDEQGDDPIQLEPIIIEGELVVGNTSVKDKMLAEFLDNHPDNGRVFRKRDIGGIADNEIEQEEFVNEVYYKIRTMLSDNKTEESVRAVGRAFGFAEAEYRETKFLKQRLYDFIKVDPYRHAKKVHDKFEDPLSKAISDIKVANDMGELIYNSSSNSVKWAGNKEVLMVVPPAKEWKEYFAKHLLSPEGFDTKAELERVVASR